MEAIETIQKKLLEKYKTQSQIDLVATSILYLRKKIAEKKLNKETNRWETTYRFDADFLLQSVAECIDNGFALDGVNYTITGNRMYMPTYHAFKNKVYMVYPESQIDIQLIRQGDTYNFAKESGSVIYTHNIADPFENTQAEIIGAYCVIKNDRGEFLETLNKHDYQEMRDSSKNPKLWDKWASEFWLKSVIKRACKRHFHDLTKAIEAKDNEVIGLEDVVKASPDKKAGIIAAHKTNTAGAETDDHNTGNTAE